MEKDKKTFLDWIKKHKKELIIAGVSVAAIIAVIIGIRNRKALGEAWASLRKLVEKTPEAIPTVNSASNVQVMHAKVIEEVDILRTDKIPHDVAAHLRNLPEGWKASAEKIATAAEHGYNLRPGQTWVEAYRTGGFAA